MVSVLFPDFASFSKLVRKMPEEEVEVLVCLSHPSATRVQTKGPLREPYLRESRFERLEQLIHARLLLRVGNLLCEEIEVFARVCQVCTRVWLPSRFEMTRDDFLGMQCLD